MKRLANGLLLPETLREIDAYGRAPVMEHPSGEIIRVPRGAHGFPFSSPPASASRNLYAWNGVDVFGFYGWEQVTFTDPGGANTRSLDRASFARATGFGVIVSGGGGITGNTLNTSIAGRTNAAQFTTQNSGDLASLYPYNTMVEVRYMVWPHAGMFGGFTKIEMEGVLAGLTGLNGNASFMGWCTSNSHDPFSPSANVYSLGIGRETVDADWSIVRNNNGVVTKTSIGVAVAINTVYELLLSFDGVTLTATVNGTTASTSSNVPTAVQMISATGQGVARFIQHGRAAAIQRAFWEWGVERYV